MNEPEETTTPIETAQPEEPVIESEAVNKPKYLKGQSRRLLLTLNNPFDNGFDPDTIEKLLQANTGLIYYVLSEEVGSQEHTHHIHIYAFYKSPIRLSTIQRKFDNKVHIDIARGLTSQCIDYVLKTGKYADSPKADTSIPGTMREFGDRPSDRIAGNPDNGELLTLIEDGYSNYDIITNHPQYITNITDIDRTRKLIKQEEFKNTFRIVEVTYIYGRNGTGKTRGAMEKHGYSNVYRITDYSHPFDSYHEEDVIIFDEFLSGLRITDMNNYLDGYPCTLPARYSPKEACYTTAYIISNVSLENQYLHIQDDPKTNEMYRAFLRRINKVIHYKSKDEIITYDSVNDYLNRDKDFIDVSHSEQMQIEELFSRKMEK